ncbi:MAG: phosphoribosylanthranilate isomerase [Lentisphaerae bacterium]|nr:phosphoribosylanthranilate isomerase [Lentisphaerota bacterium]
MNKILVKICGMTNESDIVTALELGADYVGFVLYEKSPRAIKPVKLARLVDRTNCAERSVGVFVNMSRDEVERIASDCGLAAVQLHGDESAADFVGMAKPVWRVVRFNDGSDPAEWRADMYLIDASVTGQYGGTGVIANWEWAASVCSRHPAMLAGGLNPDNVQEAISIASPMGVDVVSGVESSPGRKDPDRMRDFIMRAKAVKFS